MMIKVFSNPLPTAFEIPPSRRHEVTSARKTDARTTRSAGRSACQGKAAYFIWGFDYNFTNYAFNKGKLDFQKHEENIELHPSGKICFRQIMCFLKL